MELSEQIKQTSPKAVLNDNNLFSEWIRETLTLEDVIRRCPDVMTEIFEEFNNDWVEFVQEESANIGIEIDDAGDPIERDDEEDEEDPALAAWNAGYDDGFAGIKLDSPDPDYISDYEAGRAEGKKDRQGVR